MGSLVIRSLCKIKLNKHCFRLENANILESGNHFRVAVVIIIWDKDDEQSIPHHGDGGWEDGFADCCQDKSNTVRDSSDKMGRVINDYFSPPIDWNNAAAFIINRTSHGNLH